jgi:hypothetical protein
MNPCGFLTNDLGCPMENVLEGTRMETEKAVRRLLGAQKGVAGGA